MRKSVTLDFNAIEESKETGDALTHLARLWSTMKNANHPVTEFQHELRNMNLPPYTHLTAERASGDFFRLQKLYVRAQGPSSFFESQLRDHDIRIIQDRVKIEGKEYIPIGGALTPMTPLETTARDCANIMALYTRVKGESEPIITEAAESKHYGKAQMPALKVYNLRKMLGNYTTDVIRARNEMYAILNSKDMTTLILVTSLIYKHESLQPFCKESPQLLEKYKKETQSKIAAAKKSQLTDSSIVVPRWPEIEKAYFLQKGDFKFKILIEPEKVWRFFLISNNVRGGQKKLGALTRGYYRFDISPPLIQEIEEATDVIMIVQKLKYKAVTLEVPNVTLARTLVFNHITVYCPGLTSKLQIKDNVGVYARGSQKSFIYREPDQEPPKLTKHSIEMPDPVPISGNQPTFVVEYIPNVPQPGMLYMPSCRAAQGLCIKTNSKFKVTNEITLDALRQRFSTAIWYRNWFIFTRLTYVSQDTYAPWFNTSFMLPRIKPDMDEDFFKDAKEVEVSAKTETLYELDVTITEEKCVPNRELAPQFSNEDIAKANSILDGLDEEDLKEFLDFVVSGRVPVTHTLFCLYNFYAQHELIEYIDELLSKVEAKPPPETMLRQGGRSRSPAPAEEVEPEEDDFDLWGSAREFSTTVNSVVVPAVPETPPVVNTPIFPPSVQQEAPPKEKKTKNAAPVQAKVKPKTIGKSRPQYKKK